MICELWISILLLCFCVSRFVTFELVFGLLLLKSAVRSHRHLFYEASAVMVAFIWQARTGCYGNGLFDVEEKNKILKLF